MTKNTKTKTSANQLLNLVRSGMGRESEGRGGGEDGTGQRRRRVGGPAVSVCRPPGFDPRRSPRTGVPVESL